MPSRRPSFRPAILARAGVALLALSCFSAGVAAVEADEDTPIPPVVMARLAEAAQGAGLHDYHVDQRLGGVVYSARFTDLRSGQEQVATVTQDGRLVGIETVSSGSGAETPSPLPPRPGTGGAKPRPGTTAPLPDPQSDPPPPMRDDGRDAAPETRRGVGQQPLPGVGDGKS